LGTIAPSPKPLTAAQLRAKREYDIERVKTWTIAILLGILGLGIVVAVYKESKEGFAAIGPVIGLIVGNWLGGKGTTTKGESTA
jgi:hypothetical protein